MSLRIYIKGTPKFNSPKRTADHLTSPKFNPLPPTAFPRPKPPTLPLEPKDASVVIDSPSPGSDKPMQDSLDTSITRQIMRRRDSGNKKVTVNKRYMSNQKSEEQETFRRGKSEKDLKLKPEVKPKQAIKRLVKDSSLKRFDNKENVPERQLKGIIKESDSLIKNMVDEIERLNDLLTEKFKEVDILKELNTNLSKEVQELRAKKSVKVKGKGEESEEREEVSRLREENEQIMGMVKKLTECNNELAEEVTLLREMASTSDQTLKKERESFQRLKKKVEELLSTNDKLNSRVQEKEKESKLVEEDTKRIKSRMQKLTEELEGKNQIIEDLKKSLVVVDFQSPIHNVGNSREKVDNVTPFSYGLSTGVGSNVKMESFLGSTQEKVKEEIKDLQRKYEGAKSDNEKLIKMVESNQQVIRSLKQDFVDLEKRSGLRYEEIKEIYESKLRMATESAKKNTETETNNSSTKMSSRVTFSQSPSQGGLHSKKGSYGSAWKNKENMPVNIAFF